MFHLSLNNNNTFLNSSFNSSKVYLESSDDEIIKKEYIQIYVNDSIGNPADNVNVSFYNKSSDFQFSIFTNSSGWTNISSLIDYYNIGGTVTYYSNYLITALNSTHEGSISFNITANPDSIGYITLYPDGAPVLSNLEETIFHDNVIISWDLNQPSNYTFSYGNTSGLGTNLSSSSYNLGNSVNFSSLDRNTIYYYNITSCDSSSNCVTNGTYNFTTISSYGIDDCHVLNISNETYVLVANIGSATANPCIKIIAENITFDCQGNSIQGGGTVQMIYSNESNTTIKNCDIECSSYSNRELGIRLIESNNSYIYNNTITCPDVSGLRDIRGLYTSDSYDILFKDNVFDNEIYLVSSKNITFLNATYSLADESLDSLSSLTRKWYYRAHVVDNSSTDIANASVVAYNNTGDATMNLTTNASGWTPIGHLIDYYNIGGTRYYQSDFVMSANSNNTLFDDHVYNVTSQQNNLSDLFTVEIDITAPVLSGTNWTATDISAVINWTTDTGANSSVAYWKLGGDVSIIGDSGYTVSGHSIEITGLNALTIYYFNYTSCDFAGNCNMSSTQTFTTAAPGAEPIKGGTGQTCLPDYQCNWPACSIDGELQEINCYDNNDCTPGAYITKSRVCSVDEEEPETPTQTPLGARGGTAGCVSNWQCSEWSECKVIYNLDEIISGKVLLKGEKERNCIDNSNCLFDKTERQECETAKPIYAKKVERCFKNYIEVFDENNVLISRLELIDGEYQVLNIQMIFDDAGYCPYCFDGQLNYNEDEIDCNYDGIDCPRCGEEVPFVRLRDNYSLMLITLIALILMTLLAIVWYLVLLRKRKKRARKILRISKFGINHKKIRKTKRFFIKKLLRLIAILIGVVIGIVVFGLIIWNLIFKSGFILYVIDNLVEKISNTSSKGIGKVNEGVGRLSSLNINWGLVFIFILLILIIILGLWIIRFLIKIRLFKKTGKILRRGLDKSEEIVIGSEKKILKFYKKKYKRLRKKHHKYHKKIEKIRKRIARKQRKKNKKEGRLSPRQHKSLARDVMIFEKGIERLGELRKELNDIENKKNKMKIDKIKTKLKDVGKIPEIERDIEKLKRQE